MNKNLIVSSLTIACLFSAEVWSYGSNLDLGVSKLLPGESLVINVDESKLYEGLSYWIECEMEPVNELTAIGVYSNPYLDVSCKGDRVKGRQICSIYPGKSAFVDFAGVVKGYSYILSIKNFDQTNALTFHCKATVTSFNAFR